MIVFPNAKINIGLQVTEKRPDGFHNLTSCFYPVAWNDILEIIEAKKTSFSSSGISIPDDPQGNLCIRAYQLLLNDFPLPPVSIHLHKVIPIGAGLGGGSSDAAFTLKLLNQKFDLQLSILQLENYARQLGSDCAFFIQNTPVLATGKGDNFIPLHVNLQNYYISLIYPNLHISTKEAYSGIIPHPPTLNLKSTLETFTVASWKNTIANDFEKSIFLQYPALKQLKETLYAQGADYVSMTGSGSTFFALSQQKNAYKLPDTYTIFSSVLR